MRVACTAITQLALLLALCRSSAVMKGTTTLFLCVFATVATLTGVRAAIDVKGRCPGAAKVIVVNARDYGSASECPCDIRVPSCANWCSPLSWYCSASVRANILDYF